MPRPAPERRPTKAAKAPGHWRRHRQLTFQLPSRTAERCRTPEITGDDYETTIQTRVGPVPPRGFPHRDASKDTTVTTMCHHQGLLGRFRQVVILLVVVIDDAAVGQRQVGEKMVGANDTPDWKIGHRCIDMGHEVKPTGADP